MDRGAKTASFSIDETWDANTSGNAGGSYSYSNPSAQVQVRSYDSNGTYTGSTTTSAVWADIDNSYNRRTACGRRS